MKTRAGNSPRRRATIFNMPMITEASSTPRTLEYSAGGIMRYDSPDDISSLDQLLLGLKRACLKTVSARGKLGLPMAVSVDLLVTIGLELKTAGHKSSKARSQA